MSKISETASTNERANPIAGPSRRKGGGYVPLPAIFSDPDFGRARRAKQPSKPNLAAPAGVLPSAKRGQRATSASEPVLAAPADNSPASGRGRPTTGVARSSRSPSDGNSITNPGSGRGRSATRDANPKLDAPSDTSPAAMRGRQATPRSKPMSLTPAGNSPAIGGADEASRAPNPMHAAPRQQLTTSSPATGADEAELRPKPDPRAPRQQKSQIAKAKAKASPRGQMMAELQPDPAAGAPNLDGQSPSGPQCRRAVEPNEQIAQPDARFADPLVREIVVNFRNLRRIERARLKLVLQAQAQIRAETGCEKSEGPKIFKEIYVACKDARLTWVSASLADKRAHGAILFTARLEAGQAAAACGQSPDLVLAILPYLAAMLPIERESEFREKAITKLAKQLPVYAWIHHFPGLSATGLGKIVGECGDLGQYTSKVAGIWKRLGLAPYKGEAVTVKRQGLTKEEWTALGYSGRRRSTMWNIGGPIIGSMGRGPRPLVGEDWQNNPDYNRYQKLFISRLIHEAERDPVAHARPATKEGKMSFSAHAANRAKRYVEKRVIRRLYAAWRAADRGRVLGEPHTVLAPVSHLLEAAE